MTTTPPPYVMTQQPTGVNYSSNNGAYYGDQTNDPDGSQPYNTAVAGQPYNTAVAGQPYNTAVAGQTYNTGHYQPYNTGQYQPYGPQVTVVTQAREPAPNSCLAYSIFTCILCCWPLGILAIVFSCKSTEASRNGDMDTARSYGKRACTVSTIALACGIGIIVASVVMQYNSTSTSYYSSSSNGYYG